MVALLGLLAVAGYQNRDKISQALGGLQNNAGTDPQSGLGGLLSGLGNAASGLGLGGGLTELLDSFKASGHGEVADSWVNPSVPTRGLTAEQVEQAVGSENLDELSKRTGLTREELLQRLATNIPATVDRITPDGRMPSDEEAQKLLLPAA